MMTTAPLCAARFSSRTSITKLLMLIVVITSLAGGTTVVSASAAVVPSSTGPIKLASLMLNELLSPTSVTDLNLHLAGMDAAVAEVNANGGIRGRALELVPANTSISNPTARYDDFIEKTLPTCSAVVGGRFDTDGVTAVIAQKSSIPILGTRTHVSGFYSGAGGALSNTSLLIHQDVTSEMYQLLNFAVRGRHRCYAFAVMIEDSLPISLFETVKRDLMSIAFPAPVKILLQWNDTATSLYARVKSALDTSALNITCVIALTTPAKIKGTVDLFNANSPEYRNVDLTTGAEVQPEKELYFFATSFSDSRTFRTAPTDSPPSSSAPYRFMYFAQSYPIGTDPTMTVTQRFRAALGKIIADPTLRSVTLKSSSVPGAPMLPYALSSMPDENFGHDAMLGYLSVRLAASVLRRALNTSDYNDIMNAAFESRMFPIDDFVLGPYTNGCEGAETSETGACRCNSGSRTLYTTTVGPTGRQIPVVDNATLFELDATRIKIALTQCRVPTAFKKQVAVVVAPFNLDRPAAEIVAHRKQVSFWANFIIDNNKRSIVSEVLPYSFERQNMTANDVSKLKTRVNFLSLISSSVGYPRGVNVWQIGEFTYELPEQDAPYGPIESFDAKTWRIVPVLADTIHTAVDYARSLDLLNSIHVIVDTPSALALAQKSLATFGARSFSSILILSSSSTATVTSLPSDGFILVASQKPSVIAAVQALAITAAATATTIPSVSMSQQRRTPPVVLAGSEYVVEDHRNNDPMNPVLFVSGLRNYRTGNATTAYGLIFSEVGGVMSNTALDATGQIDGTIWASGAVATPSGALTPLSQESCGLTKEVWPHPGGTCQCRKGLNTFYIRKIARWSSTDGQAPVHRYRHAECGVKYEPLEDVSSSISSTNIGIVIGAVVGAVTVLIGASVAVYLNFCRVTGRDHKNAPKDERQPFAMVFTDIQASTTLWARAPQHMGLGLDKHHSVLRSLIAKHNGYEVKTIGDSFMVAFHTVDPATKFALEIQSALFDQSWGTDLFDDTYKEMTALADEAAVSKTAQPLAIDEVREFDEASAAISRNQENTSSTFVNSEPPTVAGSNNGDAQYNHDVWRGIRVRVGVHFGTGNIRQDETSNGFDYYGTVVNTAARVEGVAHGGQVLLTKDAFDSWTSGGSSIVPSTTAIVTNLGPQPLRGLDEPVPLIQLLPPRFAARTFPALRLDKEIIVEDDNGSDSSSFDDNDNEGDAGGVGGDHYSTSEGGRPRGDSTDTTSKKDGLQHRDMNDTRSVRSDRSRRSNRELTVESLVRETLRRRHVDLPPAIVVLLHNFAFHLLSTSTTSYRKGVIKHLGEKWRVGSHVSKWMRPYQQSKAVGSDHVLLAQSVLRAVRAMDVSSSTLGCVGQKPARTSPSISGDERRMTSASVASSGGGDGCSKAVVVGSALTIDSGTNKRFSASSSLTS